MSAWQFSAWQFSLLGYPVRLAQPAYLLFAAAALLGLLFALLAARRRAHVLAGLTSARLREKVVPAASPRRLFARGALGWAALLFTALALSQPECGSHTELAKRYGVDLVIALDASKSMLARDIKPSRIERAKLELSSLLDKLKGDRVGIVVFAGDAFVQCPLTGDYAAAKMFLRAVDPSSMPVPGTDLGRALEVSRDLLLEADRGSRSRTIVLLSDGEDFGGEAGEVVKQLKGDGIRVIAVGIGSAAGEPIPEVDQRGSVTGYVKDKQGNTVMSRLNEAGLADLAEQTDGAYVASVPGAIGVGAVEQELDRMKKSELESRITVSYDERFALFLAPVLALLLLAVAVRLGRPRRGLAWYGALALQCLAFACLFGLGGVLAIDAAQVREAAFAAVAGGGVLCFLAGVLLDRLVPREGDTP